MNGESKVASGQAVKQKSFSRSALPMNYLVTIDGKTLSIGEWCILRRLSVSTVMSRLRRGWSVEDALAFAAYGRPQLSTKVQNGAVSSVIPLNLPAESSSAEDRFAGEMVAKNIAKWNSTNNKLYLIRAQFWIESLLED